MTKYRPLLELTVTQLKLFLREPEAVFWTYGFPILMIIGLGIAFRSRPPEVMGIDVLDSSQGESIAESLKSDNRFKVAMHGAEAAFERFRLGKSALIVTANDDGSVDYQFDPNRPESVVARAAVDDCLQRAAGRSDPLVTRQRQVTEPGARYIDFLVPGLIGMNLMGAGIWGIGFAIVDMRVRKLIKRLLATPMRRHDFLLSMIGMRLIFFVPEMLALLLAAYFIFEIPVRGHPLAIAFVGLVGVISFSGLGLLVACRARRLETVSGLMNVVMMPMWLMSGIFFSADRFPDFLQPFILALPLTQLNNALRAVILEGAALGSQLVPMLILLLWAVVSFFLALKWFRWSY